MNIHVGSSNISVESNFGLERLYIAIEVKADQILHRLQNEMEWEIIMTSETEEASTQFFLNLTLILFLILIIQHYMICLIISMVSHILEQTL